MFAFLLVILFVLFTDYGKLILGAGLILLAEILPYLLVIYSMLGGFKD